MSRLLPLLLFAFLVVTPPTTAFALDEIPIGGSDSWRGTTEIVNPNIRIEIPGLNRGELNTQGVVVGTGTDENGNGCPRGEVCIRTIEIYLNALYKFLLSAGVIIAIVLVMIGGMQWMVGSTVGSHEKAHERIEHALIGLALLFSTYAILTFINPNITSLKPLQLAVITPPSEGPEVVENNVNASVDLAALKTNEELFKGTIAMANGMGLTSVTASELVLFQGKNKLLMPDVGEALLKAASTLKKEKGQRIRVASATRPMLAQITELYNNCYGKPCKVATCNPFRYSGNSPLEGSSSKGYKLKSAYASEYEGDDAIISFLTEQANQLTQTNCPHTTGAALDVWCERETGDGVDPECHEALEEAMKGAGFCRIYSEGWHFELKSRAVSTAAKACDAPVGKVEAKMSKCQSDTRTTPLPGYELMSLGGKSRCMFDYTSCSQDIGAQIFGTTGCGGVQ